MELTRLVPWLRERLPHLEGQPEVTQYTEGTLTLDMVDSSRDQLVWEGTMVSRISSDVMENLQERADAAIVRMFQDFPYTAGSSVPRPAESK